MPSDKRSVQVLLPASTEREIVEMARKEGRSLAGSCLRLIEAQLYQRRKAGADVDRIVKILTTVAAPASA